MADELEEIVNKFNRYNLGKGGFDELEVKEALLAYILNRIIGIDDGEVRGTTQDPTNPKHWTKRTKIRNELRAEQRKRLGL